MINKYEKINNNNIKQYWSYQFNYEYNRLFLMREVREKGGGGEGRGGKLFINSFFLALLKYKNSYTKKNKMKIK